MAVDTSPSLTSTISQTLTDATAMASMDPATEAKHLLLLESLGSANRHVFLQPNPALPNQALGLVKETLDAFAPQVAESQEQQLKEERKRKRGGRRPTEPVLKLRKLHLDGFETGQVWQQAKRMIAGALDYSLTSLAELEANEEILVNGASDKPKSDKLTASSVHFDRLGHDSHSDDSQQGDLPSPMNSSDDDQSADEPSDTSLDQDHSTPKAHPSDDSESDQDPDAAGEGDENSEPGLPFVQDPNGLNDGFFSIDDFNKQTQLLEEQDASAAHATDLASDDEPIDWAADPLMPTKTSSKTPTSTAGGRGQGDADDEDDNDDDDDDGPTFESMSLLAPEGYSDDEAADLDMPDEDVEFNANDIYYKDFFAPPLKNNKSARPKKVVKSAPTATEEADADVERAMADVRRDLFDDDDDESDGQGSSAALSDLSAGDPKSRRSTHERRQAKLAEEIRKLEAASVAKREWTLSGEAAAADRPANSLLEQDIDFEHVGKPVPVITPQVSEGIEELIKRRILAQEFDEVLRRRPEMATVPAATRRGLVELDDSKGEKSLAEVYEEEYAKKTDPENYTSKSDEKLQREEKEVEALWKDICARLDALSSWNYRPKPVEPSLTVVADVATISMEEAQPSTGQGIAGESSRMAPQEVYRAGTDTAKGEVATRSGLPLSRLEMSREERASRRRRHKERVRKAGTALSGPGAPQRSEGSRARMRRETVAELKKGGVMVINRKGEITDVEGNKAKAAKSVSGGSYKL